MATGIRTKIAIVGFGKSGRSIMRAADGTTDIEALPLALTKEKSGFTELPGRSIRLIPMGLRTNLLPNSLPKDVIMVDFTHPEAILENVKYYVQNGLNFVMGTTGVEGDVRRQVEKMVSGSGVCAVIAANMGDKIAGLQAVIAKTAAAPENKGGLRGDSLLVEESHQGKKADPSGTAISISASLSELGIEGCPFGKKDIMENSQRLHGGLAWRTVGSSTFVMIRGRQYQSVILGVPGDHLDRHGWHTYTITQNVINRAFGNLYDNIRDYMANHPTFSSCKKAEQQNTSDPTVGHQIERTSPEGDVFLKTWLRYDPGSMGKTPVMQLVITHNVNGGDIYASGALEAVRFLRGREETGRIFSMADVLGLS